MLTAALVSSLSLGRSFWRCLNFETNTIFNHTNPFLLVNCQTVKGVVDTHALDGWLASFGFLFSRNVKTT